MAYAAVDLRSGVAAGAYLNRFEGELTGVADADRPVQIWVNEVDQQVRVTIFADYGNIWLGDVVARLGADVDRVLIGLDHDEYGVEHLVLDGRSGALLRVHHVYVYPEGEELSEDYAPALADLPARPDLAANPDGTLTGADALAAAAALYGVDAAAVVRAVRETERAHESLQIVFEPLAPWWNALGVTYPHPYLGEPTTVLRRP
jgi:hypothetical protein